MPRCPAGRACVTLRPDDVRRAVYILAGLAGEGTVKMAATLNELNERKLDESLMEEFDEPEKKHYNCFTLYQMVESCLKEQFVQQILNIYPRLVYEKTKDKTMKNLLISNLHGVVMFIFEDQKQIENIWSVIRFSLNSAVGKDMEDYIKWFRGQIDLKKFFFENLDELIRLSDEKNKGTKQKDAVRRLQRQQNVWHHERYRALKTLLDQAKYRKDIPEYKRLYKEMTGGDIEIYTKPYSKDKLIPPDHDQDKSSEFWFNCEDIV